MPRTIADLTESLAKFIRGPGSDLIWNERVQPHVMVSLREAVGQANPAALEDLNALLEVTKTKFEKNVSRKNPPQTRVFTLDSRLESLYDQAASKDPKQAYSPRLIRNFSGLICTARLAVAAKQLSQGQANVDSFPTLLNDAVEAFSRQVPGASIQFNALEAGTSPSEIVRRSLLSVLNHVRAAREHPQAVLTALFWTLYWLEPAEKEKGLWQADHEVWLPIAAYETSKCGRIARLSLQRLRPIEGLKLGPVLIEHPDQALRPLDEVFVDTIHQAWKWGCVNANDGRPNGYVTCWSVAFDDNTPFSGSSIGGAAGAGFWLLHQGKRYDPSCLIIGQVDWDQATRGETPLLITGHENDKTNGARSHQNPRIRRVLLGRQLPEGVDVTPMSEEDILSFEDGQNFRVERVATLEKACEIASGELELLRELLESEVRLIRQQAERRIGRTFRDWQDLENLFVPVRVARGLRPKLSEKEQKELEDARRQGLSEMFDERLAIRRTREGVAGEEKEADESEQRREHVALDDIRNELDRAVILGDPGFGKTNLLWHEAILRAQESLQIIRDPQKTADDVVLVFFVPAADWAAKLADCHSEDEAAAHARDSLINLIISRSGKTDEDEKAALKSMLNWKFDTGKCFLAVDALDEVPTDRAQQWKLRAALNHLANEWKDCGPTATVWVGSRYANYTGAPFWVEDDNELELMPFEPHQQKQAIDAWFDVDSDNAARLWAHITSLPGHVQAILRNPLMLRFAIQIAEKTLPERKEIPKWQRRSDLYKDIVNNLVDRWATGRLTRDQRAAWCDFIEDVACGLWLKDAARTFWDERVIGRLIGELGEAKNQLERILNSGLMTPAAEDSTGVPLMFTHRSIGEYLAASAMARRLNERGTSSITLPDKEITKEISQNDSKDISKDTFFEYLATKAWDPDWAQVVILLAGLLDDPWPLLEALYAGEHRDLSHDRLSLVIRCLAEIDADKRATGNIAKMATEVTEKVLHVLRLACYRIHDTLLWSVGPLVGHINARVSWPAVSGNHDRPANVMPVQSLERHVEELLASNIDRAVMGAASIGQLLQDAYSEQRTSCILSFLKLRNDNILDMLLQALGHDDNAVSHNAAKTLGRIGPAAATPRVLIALLQALEDDNESLRRSVAELLGKLGSTPMNEDVVNALSVMLRDDVNGVRGAACFALCELARAGVEGAVGELVKAVKDDHRPGRLAAAYALCELGLIPKDEDVVDPWITELMFMHFDRPLGQKRAVLEIDSQEYESLDVLIGRVTDSSDPNVRAVAAAKLGIIGSHDTTDQLLGALVQAIGDGDAFVRTSAIAAIGKIGSNAATGPVLNALVEVVSQDDDYEVRSRAAGVLEKLEPEDAKHDLLIQALLQLLGVDDFSIRCVVATGLARLFQNPKVDRERVCHDLTQLLYSVGFIGLDSAFPEFFPLIRAGARFFRSTEDSLFCLGECLIVKTVEQLSRWPKEPKRARANLHCVGRIARLRRRRTYWSRLTRAVRHFLRKVTTFLTLPPRRRGRG